MFARVWEIRPIQESYNVSFFPDGASNSRFRQFLQSPSVWPLQKFRRPGSTMGQASSRAKRINLQAAGFVRRMLLFFIEASRAPWSKRLVNAIKVHASTLFALSSTKIVR